MRKVFLDELPHKLHCGNECIDWANSVGFEMNFEYDGIIGILKIVDYHVRKVDVQYNNNIYTVLTKDLRDSKIKKVVKNFTKNFRFEIGDRIKNNNADMIITDAEYRIVKNSEYKYLIKWYKYTCNKCGWTEGWIKENCLLKEQSCSCCCNPSKIIVEGINDIPTTTPWMVKYFQGGYDEAKLYTKNSGQKIIPICPDCGKISVNKKSIDSLYRSKSIKCLCSDNISYPEKFIYTMLNLLKIDFVFQLSKTNLMWCNNYLYDFYIPSIKCIIETHGLQHYEENAVFKQSLIEIQENDRLKEQLAKENGIKHYIALDCRYSTLEWIKKSVLESELPALFNFTEDDIDWFKCEELALNNFVKIACNLWNATDYSSTMIADEMKLSQSTIVRYLKIGAKYNWCDYDKSKGNQRGQSLRDNTMKEKRVEVFKDEISYGIFKSTCELERVSEKIFGVKFLSSKISAVCLNKRNHHKGYKFMYV